MRSQTHQTRSLTVQDSNASAGTRLSAAKDAVSDKMDEQKHECVTSLSCPALTCSQGQV